MSQVHVVGAGLAGLSAALALSDAGRQVTVYEAGPAAGGRCRSYFDRALNCRIDNGNHLLLSGNAAAMAFLNRIGSRATMAGPNRPIFPFMDARSGERWIVEPSRGRVPWWILRRRTRVPGSRLRDYAALLRLARAPAGVTVAGVLDDGGALWRRLLEPLAVAALNTRPDVADAQLLQGVVAQTLARGGAACIPMFPREGLSESFIDPAVAALTTRGGVVRTGVRIAATASDDGEVRALRTGDGVAIAVGAGDCVVLAVPPPVAASLLPGLSAPDAFEAILNLHFRVTADPGPAGFVGLVGGTAEWVFVKPGVVSVTISAANHLAELEADELAARVWPEVCRAVALSGPMPAVRVVKERRATFAATPAQAARRPGPATALKNLALAGDWTATGLPATIEGAIRSGHAAAEVLLSRTSAAQ